MWETNQALSSLSSCLPDFFFFELPDDVSDKVLIASLDGRQNSSAFNFYLNPSLEMSCQSNCHCDIFKFNFWMLNFLPGWFSLHAFYMLKARFHYFKEHFADCMTRLDWVVAALFHSYTIIHEHTCLVLSYPYP